MQQSSTFCNATITVLLQLVRVQGGHAQEAPGRGARHSVCAEPSRPGQDCGKDGGLQSLTQQLCKGLQHACVQGGHAEAPPGRKTIVSEAVHAAKLNLLQCDNDSPVAVCSCAAKPNAWQRHV